MINTYINNYILMHIYIPIAFEVIRPVFVPFYVRKSNSFVLAHRDRPDSVFILLSSFKLLWQDVINLRSFVSNVCDGFLPLLLWVGYFVWALLSLSTIAAFYELKLKYFSFNHPRNFKTNDRKNNSNLIVFHNKKFNYSRLLPWYILLWKINR